MKYTLNKLTPKTTNHFGVNDLKIELTIPTIKKMPSSQIIGDTNQLKIKEEIKKEPFTSKIGLEYNKYKELSIKVPKNTNIQEPIQFIYSFEKEEHLVHKIKIIVEESSSIQLIIKYQSKENTFHYLKEEVVVKENASATITHINTLNKQSTNLIAFENQIEENATLTENLIDMGGNIRIYNMSTESKKYQSKYFFHNLYIGKKEDIIDMNYYMKNRGINSNNQLRVEGVLKDKAKKTFRGTIDFIEGCKNAIGEENENCILLSDSCKSKSLPMMLCHEEDVIGSHGVSNGKVSIEKLFYLMTRGFSKKEAERLIVLANFHKIIEKIPEKETQQEIIEAISKQI